MPVNSEKNGTYTWRFTNTTSKDQPEFCMSTGRQIQNDNRDMVNCLHLYSFIYFFSFVFNVQKELDPLDSIIYYQYFPRISRGGYHSDDFLLIGDDETMPAPNGLISADSSSSASLLIDALI